MFVPGSVFTNKDDKRNETNGDAKKRYHHKTEYNVSKIKVQNNELDHDMENVHENKLL